MHNLNQASTTASNPHRLPRTVVPSAYVLRLEPDLAAASFAGHLTVSATASSPVAEIALNAIELDITSVDVRQNGSSLGVSDFTLDEELERLTISLADEAAAGPLELTFVFTGVLNDKLRGFYRSTYTDEDGVEHALATTQFESTNARRAFPCWDEPDVKATFDVTLVVDADLLAVSCQSEISSEDLGDGRRAVTFATTPIMSTYLLAFVVGRMEATEPVTAGGVPMRIIHVPGKGDMTSFALDAGKFALDWLTEYFGIPYPGDKCDMIAIPDFAFGAMENLGCVTYREILLIVDPDKTTQPEQQRSVDVIAHELAHMWFGDLVTMKWWNGLWLKEAFATFMEMLVTDAYRPEWHRWVDFGRSRNDAFDVDSLSSTRAIEFEVLSPADAEGMYDVLTYEKGAAVVRMLQQYLGEEEFRTGVSKYLARHAFANTETHDLWDALEESTGEPVRQIMDSWIFQGGYPLVSVETENDNSIRLSQTQFRYVGGTDAQWAVPVVLTCQSNGARTDKRLLLDSKSTTVGPDEVPDWVLVNTGAAGFYRVAYSDELMTALLNNLADIAPIERFGLVDDVWARLQAGSVSVAETLDIVERFADETDVSVWQAILGILGGISRHTPEADRPAMESFVRALVRPTFDRLGAVAVANEDDRTGELRAAVFRALGNIGEDADVIALAREINADSDAAPSMQAAALGIVAAHGTDDDFASVRERFRNATTPQEERRSLFALAQFPSADHMQTMLEMNSAGEVRTQDSAALLAIAMRNRRHGRQAWTFVTENWDDLNTRLPDNSIPRMMSGISGLAHADLVDDVVAFVDAHPVPQGGLSVAQDLEKLHLNVALRARVEDEVGPALSDRTASA